MQSAANRIGRLCLICAVLSAANSGLAEGQGAPKASEVAALYLNALADERWQDAAALVHAETIRFFRARLTERLECPSERARPTFEEFRRADPAMPRAVAEYLYQRNVEQLEHYDQTQSISSQFPGTETLEQLRQLPPVEFLARYLAGQRRLGGDGPPAFHPVTVVGEVAEGEWVNVLYRYTFEPSEADPSGPVGFYRPPPRIIRIRRDGGGYWVASAFDTRYPQGILGPGVLGSMNAPACPVSP